MSLETRVIALAQGIGADVKAIRTSQGELTSLTTTSKASIVSAINELVALLPSSGLQINDTAGSGATTVTWSADKIVSALIAAQNTVKNEILDGAGAAFDTLAELQALITADQTLATTLATEVANRVRYDAAQVLTNPQKAQARSNIDAASETEYQAFVTSVGNVDFDFLASYNTAKA